MKLLNFCFNNFHFFDLTEENVRNRWLTAAAFLLIYIFVVFTFLGDVLKANVVFTDINLVFYFHDYFSKYKWVRALNLIKKYQRILQYLEYKYKLEIFI